MIFKNFKKIVFNICRELNISVIRLYESGITPNFHTAHIRTNDIDLFVLCSYNNHWAYSSFFSETECRLTFVDFPEFSKLLIEFYDIQPHDSKELYNSFTNKYNQSKEDIKYWKPQTEGEGLFNWWD